jgi:hypothetical protein
VRRHAGSSGPAPPLGDPLRGKGLVGARQAAQLRGGPGQRLVELALRRPLEDPGHLGQQVGPVACQRAELGHRSGFLLRCERAPLGVMSRLAGQLGDEDAVGVGSGTILGHLARIEHGYDKSKVARLMVGSDTPVLTPGYLPRASRPDGTGIPALATLGWEKRHGHE